MASTCHLLDLPDLVLHHICTFVTNPFDLLNFGSVCTRLRHVTSSASLWWHIAFDWFEGLWYFIKYEVDEEDPRAWFLEMLKKLTILPTGTPLEVKFANGDTWKRSESRIFRCHFGMLRLAYEKEKEDNPAVLYEQWLYDIALYCRVNPQSDFSSFSDDDILQLSSLGQAAERDLRRRKQPNKDLKYYVKHVAAAAESNWMDDLFPTGMRESVCPLLVCPFQDSDSTESSGIEGLFRCVSIFLNSHFKEHYKGYRICLRDFHSFILRFCKAFDDEFMQCLRRLLTKLGHISLIHAVGIMLVEKLFNNEEMKNVLKTYRINLDCDNILKCFFEFLKKNGIDCVVDSVRCRLRKSLHKEINSVLFSEHSPKIVARINLTDSDLIGGDNYKQEMSAAAFITSKGVLVTWHLIGRMRF